MAVLEKIRVKFGIVISVVIALALLSFIIDPNTLATVANTFSSKYRVGKIDGNSVSYQDFDNQLNYQNMIFESMYGRSANSDQELDFVRDNAWKTFIDRYLFLVNARKAGINVGDAEMVQLTSGDMVSPIIAQSFIDETGSFSKERLSSFLQSMDYDPSGQAKMIWEYLKNTVNTEQIYNKYYSLFRQSYIVNPLMMTEDIAENNNSVNVEFVMLPYGYAPDSTIVVSDAEIKDYYKKHKELYKQLDSRDLEYIIFEVKPSAEDIAATNEQVVKVYDEFASIEPSKMKSFLMKNSDRQYTDEWFKRGELNLVSSDIDKFVFDGKEEVSGVLTKDNTFYVARVMDSAMVPDSVFVKHILLQGEQENLADSLLNVLNRGRESFSNVAAQYSADQNMQVAERGDLGWMTKNNTIPGMESVFTAPLNKVFVLDTQYGKHLVKVTDRTEPLRKKKVAILEREAVASGNTINEYYVKANEAATLADGKYDQFRKVVEENGYNLLTLNHFTEGTETVGVINDRTKEVSKWAYEEAKVGKVSNVINVNNDYYVIAALTKIHKKGYIPVEEVAPRIKDILYAGKYGEKKAAEVAEKIAGLGSMEAIAEALNTTVSTKDGVSFSSYANQGLDPKFIGAVSVAEEGKISAPLAGSIGVYVYRVLSHETGSSYNEDDARNKAAQMSYYSLQSLIPTMMVDADVEDNRARFY